MPQGTLNPDGLMLVRVQRAIWRWHFYAGLLSLPFLILLAVTGSVYLFEEEIDRALFHDMTVVSAGETQQAPEELIAAALAAKPGWEVARYVTPLAHNRTAEIVVVRGDDQTSIFVDPYKASVTGVRNGESPMSFVSKLHSLAVAGPYANLIIEAVAGWTIILFATGVYLWLQARPTKQASNNRPAPSRRQLWVNVHTYTGLGAGAVIVFLAFTGLPWSSFWGGGLHDMARHTGLGMPAEVWGDRPQSRPTDAGGPWIIEGAARPLSPQPTPSGTAANPIGFAKAATIALNTEMPEGFWIEAPWGPSGVYTAMAMPDDATAQRILHIDQYTGETLMDIRYADYGAIARTVEFGVSLHMGRQLGWANKVVMLLGCVALFALAVTSLAMTWRRRNNKPLAPPKVERRSMTLVSGIVCAGLIAFPITALTAIVIAIADLSFTRLKPNSA